MAYSKIFKSLLLGVVIIGLGGCLSDSSELKQGESYSKFDVNRFAVNKLVCDPFDDIRPTDLTQGLHAKLWYLDSSQPRYKSVGQMLSEGHSSDQELFFSEVIVPTRLFSLGFPKESGGVVQDDIGQDLIEYFAIELNGGLRLGPDDLEGEYEFALLSDDGSIMSVAEGDGEYTVVVNNDGDHPTKLGCGSTLNFTNQTQYKVNFKYYQGPRYHISMIPLWRRVTNETKAETQCGKLGNSMYFDYNNNSTPQQAYKDLLARGWRPLTKDNYLIPREVGYNPCVESPEPEISNLVVSPIPGGGVRVSWTTDVPATSQVRYFDSNDSSQETLTTSDNILRTEHEVVIYGLTSDTNYTVQAISITDDYGKGFSEEITFTAM